MATRNSIESTIVRFARHLHARCGLAEATVHNYVSAIRRLAPDIGFVGRIYCRLFQIILLFLRAKLCKCFQHQFKRLLPMR
jgi:hypothetical protein